MHCRLPFDLVSHDGVDKFRRFLDDAADLVVSYGGSLRANMAMGRPGRRFLTKMFGEELVRGLPRIQVDLGSRLENESRQSCRSESARRRTAARARLPSARADAPISNTRRTTAASRARRCVAWAWANAGAKAGGTMCPSYMVTREEKHATRGRAHLLFEMLRGEVIGKDGWRDDAVKEALDLCLACKGCKGDCPVNVDMATYKAEFLAHYWKGRLRPIHAYAFGFDPYRGEVCVS